MKGDWSPGKKYQTLLSQIQDVLEGGEKRTVRDVYYALEARGNPWEYKRVKRAVKKGRRAGYINPAQIVDTSRKPTHTARTGYEDPWAFLDDRIEGAWSTYYEDPWRYQDEYVEVWLEKQALASVFEPICQEYNVRLEATRGDWSDSKVHQATQRIARLMRDGIDVTVLYFGDYNPSGYHAPVSILERMGYYGIELPREFPGSDDRRYYDPEHRLPANDPEDGGSFDLERVAINTEHLEKFDLPENPVPSGSDKDEEIKRHFRRFVSDGKDRNVELNALKEWERDFLEDLIQESIEEHIDEDTREDVERRVEGAQAALRDAIDIDRSGLEERFDPPIDASERTRTVGDGT